MVFHVKKSLFCFLSPKFLTSSRKFFWIYKVFIRRLRYVYIISMPCTVFSCLYSPPPSLFCDFWKSFHRQSLKIHLYLHRGKSQSENTTDRETEENRTRQTREAGRRIQQPERPSQKKNWCFLPTLPVLSGSSLSNPSLQSRSGRRHFQLCSLASI